MHPRIDDTHFGSITIGGEVYSGDVVICLDGRVKNRKKKLSKAQYGTSHIVSLDEAQYIHQEGAECLIIGAGLFSRVKLSKEASLYLEQQNCAALLLPTKKAIKAWNKAEGAVIGMFHVTC
jgi:hypothetical protein